MRTLAELTTTEEPAWPRIQALVATAPSAKLLPRDPARADEALLALQITVRSPLGALVHGSGGLLVDPGWLRLLGSGNAKLQRSVPALNTNGSGLLLVGDEAFASYPFLWAEGEPIERRVRRPVPIAEMFSFALDMQRQLGAE